METSRASTLKPWITEYLGRGKLGIECPHCHGKAVVTEKRWLETKGEFIGRSCTYCFKTARVPTKRSPRRSS